MNRKIKPITFTLAVVTFLVLENFNLFSWFESLLEKIFFLLVFIFIISMFYGKYAFITSLVDLFIEGISLIFLPLAKLIKPIFCNLCQSIKPRFLDNIFNKNNNFSGDNESMIDEIMSDDDIQHSLEAIEDKLMERGLVSAVIGGNPILSLRFEFINPYGFQHSSLYLVLSIQNEDDDHSFGDFESDDFDDAIAYIEDKVEDNKAKWLSKIPTNLNISDFEIIIMLGDSYL